MGSRILRVTSVIVLTLGASGCARGGNASSTFDLNTVEGFQPTDGRFAYEQPISVNARDVWDAGWFDDTTMAFEPSWCRDYATDVEMLLSTDDSTTGSDGLDMIFGYAGEDATEDGLLYLYVTARVFSTPEAALEHLTSLESAAAGCVDGYRYASEGGAWAVSLLSVKTTTLGGVPSVLVIDDEDVTVSDPDGNPIERYGHYTHYIHASGNVLLVAAYTSEDRGAADADAGELIADFIAYLDEASSTP